MALPVKARLSAAVVAGLQSLTGDASRLSIGLVITPGESLTEQQAADILATTRAGAVACEVYFGDDERAESTDTQSNLEIWDFPIALLLHLPDKPMINTGSPVSLEDFEAAPDVYGRICDLMQGNPWRDAGSPDGLAQDTYIMGGGGGPFIHDEQKTKCTTAMVQIRYRVSQGNWNQPR